VVVTCSFYDVTNSFGACCEVVIDKKSTSGPRGLVYLMISWDPIPTKENIFKVTPYGLGTNSINQALSMVIFPCIILDGKRDHIEKDKMSDIGVVIPKSRRMVGVLLSSGVVGLDLDSWVLYLVGVVEKV
jgi:hypothetical protein